MTSTEHTDRPVTLSGVRVWLPLLLTLAALLVSLGVSQQRIAELDRTCEQNTSTLKLHDATFMELQIRLAEMQKDLAYIRLTLDKLDKAGGR